MAVNLEELALKSIEQYAAFGVRLLSIENTLIEISRKAESKEEKFIIACDKLSRLEEKFINFSEDKAILSKRIDDISSDVNSLANSVRDLVAVVNGNYNSFQEHQISHCDGCINSATIQNMNVHLDELASLVDKLYNKDLDEVRLLATSKWGLLWLRFIASKYGQWWVALVTANIVLAFFVHWEIFRWILEKIKIFF